MLVVCGVPRHLGYRAAVAPERLAAILAATASLLGDAILRTETAARSRQEDYEEYVERYIQKKTQVQCIPTREHKSHKPECLTRNKINGSDHYECAEGCRGLGRVTLVAKPCEF